MTDTDTRPAQYEFNVTREAVDTLRAMGGHVDRIGADWGITSKEYVEALQSYARNVTTLFSQPMTAETSVWRDGDLSLCASGGIVRGLIWHGTRRTCTDADCHAIVNDDGSAWSYNRETYPVLDHEHTLSYPLTSAQPGTWSFHS